MDKKLHVLIDAFGVNGRNSEIKKAIISELEDINCDIKQDKAGNLIVKIGEGNEKVMFCTYIDTAGFIVSYIEDNGFLRVLPVGNIKSQYLPGNFVKFENGTRGRICSQKSNPKVTDLFIDLAVDSKEEALKVVNQGSICTIDNKTLEIEDKIISYGLESRIGCYILLNLIRNIKNLNKELHFVFSSNGQADGKSARAAAFNIKPDMCIVVDTKETGDVIGGSGNLKLKNGPVISIMDKSLIINDKVKDILDKAAQKAKINIQYSIDLGNNEGGDIHKEAGGIKTAMVAVPCRYKNSVSEMISKEDIKKVQNLLNEIIIEQ